VTLEFLLLIDKTQHFLMLIDNCHESAQADSLSNESCNETDGLLIFTRLYSKQFQTIVSPQQTDSISLINTRKSIGPSTDPCGTPLRTVVMDEKHCSIATH